MKKNTLTKEDILHLAKLSKLQLTDEEIEKFRLQLSSVVDYISKLNEVDTDNVVAVSQITGLTDVMRADEIDEKRKLSQAETLKNARSSKNGFIKVKAIFNQ